MRGLSDESGALPSGARQPCCAPTGHTRAFEFPALPSAAESDLALSPCRAPALLRRGRAELAPVPAGKSAWRREAQQRRDFGQRAIAVLEIALGEFPAHGHYMNMVDTRSTKVACGMYTMPNVSLWAVQDFR